MSLSTLEMQSFSFHESGIVPHERFYITASLLAFVLVGCASESKIAKKTEEKAGSTRALTPECRPVSEEFARRLRGDQVRGLA